MYLPSEIIRELLESVDSIFSDIPILVSCDFNKSKRRGDLFSLFITTVQDKLGTF